MKMWQPSGEKAAVFAQEFPLVNQPSHSVNQGKEKGAWRGVTFPQKEPFAPKRYIVVIEEQLIREFIIHKAKLPRPLENVQILAELVQ